MDIKRRYNPLDNLFVLSITASAFAVNQFILKNYFPGNTLVHSWGNDLLAMPAVFSFGAIARAATRSNIAFTKCYYLGITSFCSFIFEYARPIFVSNSVMDIFDILAYCIGAAAYVWWAK